MISRRKFLSQSGLAAAARLSRHGSQSAPQVSEHAIPDLARDPHRPQYHFLPKAYWVNDPNGPIFWRGYYHLFYQYSPTINPQGPKQWGHARSRDMIQWEHLPIALEPTPGEPDKEGCWSGSTFINGGVPTIIYTGVMPQCQCLATSNDNLLTWKKSAANPVIAAPPAGLEVTGFRDPTIWREDNTWLMTVGSGFRGQGGAVLLYASKDLAHWEYLHPLFTAPAVDAYDGHYDSIRAGEMWECPDFFPLGGKHVLLVSTQGRVHYFLGDYSNREFQAEAHGLVDGSSLYYAAKSFADVHGRRVIWGWVREARPAAAQAAAGWSGAISLPRVASIDRKGRLRFDPLPRLAALRLHTSQFTFPGTEDSLAHPELRESRLEFQIVVELRASKGAGLVVRRSPGGEEETSIRYDADSENLILDTTRSSLNPETVRGAYRAPLKLDANDSLQLRVFLDASVVEIFANGRACLTGRIYPTRADSFSAGGFFNGAQGRVIQAEVYNLGAISPNRLTT